jgi:RimJ/RimL family protein N-acetyltransferase
MHTTYTGEKVRLRPYRDEAEYADLCTELGATPNLAWGPWHSSRPELKSDFDPAGLLDLTKYSQFAIERLDTGEVVGFEEFGGIAPGTITSWVGTYILPRHQRQGFGIEAKQLAYCAMFENLPVTRVHACTLSNHPRAQRGLELSGMTLEGTQRQAQFSQGSWVDIKHYVIFREQWLDLPIRESVQRGAM